MRPHPAQADDRERRLVSSPDDLDRYLHALARADADGRLLEIRSRRAAGMAQRFVPAGDIERAADAIRAFGARTDVYVGVLLRDRRAGGRAAISGGRVVFVEVDATAARKLLARAPAPPSIVVASGTPGHLHAYWLLRERVSIDQVEEANRKLCHRIDGDPASVDCARILRPPQTLNHKHTPARPVQLLQLDERRIYPLAELTHGLEDPHSVRRLTPIAVRQPAAGRRSRPDGDLLHAQLRQISTGDYVLFLTGQEPNREGKVHCPFHKGDRTPSLQCYDDGTFCCFGCMKGGTIFDFAGALWGMDTKGRDFIVLRQRLGGTFGLADRATARPAAGGERPLHLRRGTTHDNQEVQR